MWVSGSDIYLEGSIKHEDSARLNYIINNNPQTNRVVIVQSPGGNLYAGIRMGQMIRSKGLETYLHKDCSSACNHIFAGGFFRDMASTARLGLHIGGQTYDYAVYTTRDLFEIQRRAASTMVDRVYHYLKMGISIEVLDIMATKNIYQIRWMYRTEAQRTNFVNK